MTEHRKFAVLGLEFTVRGAIFIIIGLGLITAASAIQEPEPEVRVVHVLLEIARDLGIGFLVSALADIVSHYYATTSILTLLNAELAKRLPEGLKSISEMGIKNVNHKTLASNMEQEIESYLKHTANVNKENKFLILFIPGQGGWEKAIKHLVQMNNFKLEFIFCSMNDLGSRAMMSRSISVGMEPDHIKNYRNRSIDDLLRWEKELKASMGAAYNGNINVRFHSCFNGNPILFYADQWHLGFYLEKEDAEQQPHLTLADNEVIGRKIAQHYERVRENSMPLLDLSDSYRHVDLNLKTLSVQSPAYLKSRPILEWNDMEWLAMSTQFLFPDRRSYTERYTERTIDLLRRKRLKMKIFRDDRHVPCGNLGLMPLTQEEMMLLDRGENIFSNKSDLEGTPLSSSTEHNILIESFVCLDKRYEHNKPLYKKMMAMMEAFLYEVVPAGDNIGQIYMYGYSDFSVQLLLEAGFAECYTPKRRTAELRVFRIEYQTLKAQITTLFGMKGFAP